MKETIITKRLNAIELMQIREMNVEWEDDAFLLYRNGEIRTLLPGRQKFFAGNEVHYYLAICRNVMHSGIAGVGNILNQNGSRIGGWARFRCTLLSTSRFVKHHQDQLAGGIDPQEILTQIVRSAMTCAFRSVPCLSSTPRAVAWRQCREFAECQLLECGWQLEEFELRHFQMSKEVER